MTDYTKLVEALRHCASVERCDGICEMNYGSTDCESRLEMDAADAIEALQAENPIVESVLVDKMRQQMEETVCHCNVKENAELIAKILDDDVDRKVFELPKRGEWVHRDEFDYMDMNEVEHSHFMCNKCGFIHDFLDGHTSQYKYCPNCGAKMMEVQE